jgi:hypothetical protein
VRVCNASRCVPILKSLMAYRPGSEKAIALPVELDQSFLDKASG